MKLNRLVFNYYLEKRFIYQKKMLKLLKRIVKYFCIILK
jgi:hypothetical protein